MTFDGGIKLANKICVASSTNGSTQHIVNPNAWKFGKTFNKLSPGTRSGTCSKQALMSLNKFSCVSGTAFGSPVVPEVEKITANFLSCSVTGSSLPVICVPFANSEGLNLTHGLSADFRASSSSGFTLSEITTLNGCRRSSVRISEISPVFSFSGQNTPPSLHAASITANITGLFGMRTANLCPRSKPAERKDSVTLSASCRNSLRLIHLCSYQQQLLSGLAVKYSSIIFSSIYLRLLIML